jgi:uncharacterized surface protein with fasciclin (FAS1) repeats
LKLAATPAAALLLAVSLPAVSAWAQSPPAEGAGSAMASSPNLVASGAIYATLKASPHFTILVKALDQAQLSAVLSTTPGLTLFAPTDEAFGALPPAQLAALLTPDNAPILQKILIYHLVNAKLDAAKIKGAKGPVPSVETSQLHLDGSGPVLKVNDADIIQADVQATNGTIHVVDKVLIPPDVTLPAG